MPPGDGNVFPRGVPIRSLRCGSKCPLRGLFHTFPAGRIAPHGKLRPRPFRVRTEPAQGHGLRRGQGNTAEGAAAKKHG